MNCAVPFGFKLLIESSLYLFFRYIESMPSCVLRTYSAERDKLVLPWVDVLVIGPVSPHVSRAVDQPGGVQHQGVPQQSGDEVRHPQRLPPQVKRHEHGDEEAHEQHRHLVIPFEEKEWVESRKNGT